MSTMSQLSYDLKEAQEEAWEAAMVLEQKLGAISELLWQNRENAPALQAPADLLCMLTEIQTELAPVHRI